MALSKIVKQIEFKFCISCKQDKQIDDFYAHKGYFLSRCKKCHCLYTKQYQKNNPEKASKWRKSTKEKLKKSGRLKPKTQEKMREYNLKTRFNITNKDYEIILESQGGSCAICKSVNSNSSRSKKLAVDHCHKTGRVRGILCFKCNSGLGNFNDNVNFLSTAISYLGSKDGAK